MNKTKVLSIFSSYMLLNRHILVLIWTKYYCIFVKRLRMKQVTILVPAGSVNLSSVVGTFEILTEANEYWKKTGTTQA